MKGRRKNQKDKCKMKKRRKGSRKKGMMRSCRLYSSSRLCVASSRTIFILSFPSLPPSLFDPFFKSLPNSCVLPRRLFVCTSIISGDKRRPFDRTHVNLKPDALTFVLLSFGLFFNCFSLFLWSERLLRQVDVRLFLFFCLLR